LGIRPTAPRVRIAALLLSAPQHLSAEQIAKWRTEIARRQEDAKVTRLSGLIEDRIRDGRLTETDDSAKSYMQELQSAVPASTTTDRVARELTGAYLRKAREAALAKNSAEEERWLGEARANGAKPADILAFQKDLTGARQKAAQAEGERLPADVARRHGDGALPGEFLRVRPPAAIPPSRWSTSRIAADLILRVGDEAVCRIGFARLTAVLAEPA